mmetsp:Transcript_121611/g.295125  ORF Transcript_121611/g.295125 Transcript_121611/m.295125 type:complete len:269 (-) Transcript_121611:30-836(-)
MATIRVVTFALLCASASSHATHAQSALRHNDVTQASQEAGLVRPLEFDHRLRVCNAFPYGSGLDVIRGKESLTGSLPMPYKDCRDFHSQLRSGDKLEFKIGDSTAGTFSVSELPANDAVLLLVVYRHDTMSTAVSFESHVFANLKDAQVAIIDTYKGSKHSTPKIMDRKTANKKARSEELRYSSVVAVSPGVYDVDADAEGRGAKAELVALHHESYVILRTGVEARQGPSYPEEIVVYPHSDITALHSGVSSKAPWVLLILATMALAL